MTIFFLRWCRVTLLDILVILWLVVAFFHLLIL